MTGDGPVADLHIHTDVSDGTVSVDERVRQAREQGLSTIAITDHDAIANELSSTRERRDDLEVVTGVEVRADLFDTKIEILGYYLDPDEDALTSLLERVRGYRDDRNREMVAKLREETGLDLSLDELEAGIAGSLGRPHLAEVLVDEGVVDSIGEAFDEFLGDDGKCYTEMRRVGYEAVIDAIHRAGGLASLAHPGRIRTNQVDSMLEKLVDAGLDGVEVWYPYGDVRSDDYAEVDVESAHALADEYGLLKTGGSDCHGPGSGKFRLGEVGVPANAVDAIRANADPG